MYTVDATETCVTIRLSGEPLPTGQALRRLVFRALAARSLPRWDKIESECYTAGEETLILARPGEPALGAVSFPDYEALSTAARACGTGGGALFRREEDWLLLLPENAIPPALYDFGEILLLPPAYISHAREHFREILPENALSLLAKNASAGEM